MGQILDRQQLATLIDYQRKQAPHLLTEQEARILHGSLDFSTLSVQNLMVPLNKCFCLDIHAVINPGLRAAVGAAGYSRIPVIDRSTSLPHQHFAVIGLIHVKDLLLMDMELEVPLRALLPLIGREVFVVDDDRPLPEVLDEFRRGASQLAVVRSLVDNEDCDPYFRHVGILTLQDLLNTIIQDDVHEMDVDLDNRDSETATVPKSMFSNVPRFRTGTARATSASRVKAIRGLSQDEVIAIAAFLRRRYAGLFGTVNNLVLEAFLLQDCRLSSGVLETKGHDNSTALYRRGVACNFATLIINGDVKVFAGREGFESIHGPWSLLGQRCLEINRLGTGGCSKGYVPDFTAYVAEVTEGFGGARLLFIMAEPFQNLLNRTGANKLVDL